MTAAWWLPLALLASAVAGVVIGGVIRFAAGEALRRTQDRDVQRLLIIVGRVGTVIRAVAAIALALIIVSAAVAGLAYLWTRALEGAS